MTSKADYVRLQPQTRPHKCHWPGCEAEVPPAMWGCIPHWYTLPAMLRAKVWRTFVPGQEITLTPSEEYLAVMREVQAWISKHLAAPRQPRPPRRSHQDQGDLFGA